MSTTPIVRRMISEFTIGVMVCAGGFYFLVNPVHLEKARVREQIERAYKDAAGTPGIASLTDDQVRDLQRVTSERADEIARRSLPARDESVMFSQTMDLAARHNVRVDQLQPNGAVVSDASKFAPTPAANPADPTLPPPPKDVRVAYTISAVGTYSDLAAFTHSLQHRLGYTNVRGMRLSPAGDDTPNLVHAIIDTELFAFDLNGVNAQPAKPFAAAPQPE